MLISYEWLKTFVDLPRKMTPEQLAVTLTEHTVEVDAVIKAADRFRGVVVAKITAVKPHPNADKLRIATVKTGKDIREIVCGAPNIATGQLVPLALPGTVLPSGAAITEAEIRGVKSAGMLCAPDELGLGTDHSGILILDKRAKAGQELAQYLKLSDAVIDISNKSITNRPDLWSHYGMARDLAAVLGIAFRPALGQLTLAAIAPKEQRFALRVSVEDQTACPRYMAAALGGVKVAPSPQWLQDRLSAIGIRPINNLVDITNYVMCELGQPLHAFDATTLSADLSGAAILVRGAKAGETITTLDGEVRTLETGMLLITDGNKPVAVAGVMGGENSEIGDATTTIVLESATFEHRSIRKTASRLGMRTEASQRYEKALDPNLAETALARAVTLLLELCPGASLIGTVADVRAAAPVIPAIEFDGAWLQTFLGEHLTPTKIRIILERLGFSVTETGRHYAVVPPSWRATRDITIKEDVAEEIARVYGYNKIAAAMPPAALKPPVIDPDTAFQRRLRDIMSGPVGATEVMSHVFVGEDALKRFGLDPAQRLRLANPLNKDQSHLRQSLAITLLPIAAQNQARVERAALYEIASVFLPFDGKLEAKPDDPQRLPFQETRLGILAIEPDRASAYRRVKALIERLTAELRIAVRYQAEEQSPEWAEDAYATIISVAGERVGTLYLPDVATMKRIGMKKPAAVAELSVVMLRRLATAIDPHHTPVPKFPSATRDLAFVVGEKMLYNDLRDFITGFHPLIRSVELFDVFSGDQVGAGKKSLAFHIGYQADRTLTNEEVDALQKELCQALADRFEAKIRDF